MTTRLPLHEWKAADLSFAYGDTPVLANLSFTAKPGELIALVGPNGCGKSTLLKLLLGILSPSSGSITLDNRPLSHYGRIGIARRAALVPQISGGDSLGANFGSPGFSVQQTVLMARYAAHVDEAPGLLRAAGGLGIFGFETPEDYQLAQQAMWTADVHHLAHRPLDTLSGGERQRVAIARALAQQTPALFLDEPTSALDLFHQLELIDHLKTAINPPTGTAPQLILLVTHDLNLAATCATRILLLDQAQLIADGPPQEVLTPALLEPVYHVHVITTNSGLKFERRQH